MGYTIEQARNYANSYDYSPQNNIKETVIYGNGGARLNSPSRSSFINQSLKEIADSREHIFSKDITNLSDNMKKSEIGNLIRQNIDEKFNISDYAIKISHPKTNDEVLTIYDYVLVVDGIETNIAYTIFINKGQIKIYDNTKNMSIQFVKEKLHSISTKKISKTEIEIFKNNILEKNKIISKIDYSSIKEFYASKNYNSSDMFHRIIYSYSITNEYKFYDAMADKLYYIIDVESKDVETNSTMVYSEKIEI